MWFGQVALVLHSSSLPKQFAVNHMANLSMSGRAAPFCTYFWPDSFHSMGPRNTWSAQLYKEHIMFVYISGSARTNTVKSSLTLRTSEAGIPALRKLPCGVERWYAGFAQTSLWRQKSVYRRHGMSTPGVRSRYTGFVF